MQTNELISPEITPDEARLLPAIIGTNKSPNEFIPDDIDPSLLRQYLSITSHAYLKAQTAVSKLKPFLGRVLVLYKKNPDLYRSLGYKAYDDWMSKGVRELHGLSRVQAYEVVNIAEQCGHINSATTENLGFSKLNVVAKIAKQSVGSEATVEMREARVNEWVQKALEPGMTVAKLRELAEEQHVVEPGSLEPRVPVSFSCTIAQKEFFDAFLKSPEVHEYCGSEDIANITEKAFQECVGEWQQRRK